MSTIRRPAVAGLFYPDEAEQLRRDVEGYIAAAPAPDLPRPARGIIAPHAGYPYSGPVAGVAYRAVRDGSWRKALVVGPAHRHPLHGLALPDCEVMRTPLGDLPVDAAAAAKLAAQPLVEQSATAHAEEHSIEVQLPFLQVCREGPTVVPLLAGLCGPETVAEALAVLWDDDTLLVVSTDLSHFEGYATATDHDRRTIDAVLAGRLRDLDGHAACGYVAVAGALQECGRRGHEAILLDYRNSGDTAGDKSRVVGYAAFAIA